MSSSEIPTLQLDHIPSFFHLLFLHRLAPIIFILQRNLFLMAEAQLLPDFADTNLQPQNDPSSKLPRINPPRSRDAVRSKNEKRKTPPLLPYIKPAVAVPLPPPQTPPQSTNQPDSFATEIEERLKMVLENVNQGEEITEDAGEDQQVDFEELIQQNREKIKQNKLVKNQGEVKETKAKSKTLKNKNENSIYQKRIKEYRDASTENKFIQKRKEVIALRQEAIERANEKAKTIKMKEENNQNYSSSITKLNIPKSNARPKYSAKDRKSQEPTTNTAPPVTHGVKIAQLFDNIHNFLLNPFKARAASESRKPNPDNIKQLQQKIKQINDKLGVKEEQKGSLSLAVEQKTVLDWKRLQYNRGSDFRCHYDSNFEKEVEKINNLQQKNSHSLTHFLDHQKALAELTLLRKVTKKPEGKTS